MDGPGVRRGFPDFLEGVTAAGRLGDGGPLDARHSEPSHRVAQEAPSDQVPPATYASEREQSHPRGEPGISIYNRPIPNHELIFAGTDTVVTFLLGSTGSYLRRRKWPIFSPMLSAVNVRD